MKNLNKEPVAVDYRKQFQELKVKHQDRLLLFRAGDFYETYEGDAEKAASILHITLTSHQDKDGKFTKQTMFPYTALDIYLPKLIKAGEKVAICDQIKTPTESKAKSS